MHFFTLASQQIPSVAKLLFSIAIAHGCMQFPTKNISAGHVAFCFAMKAPLAFHSAGQNYSCRFSTHLPFSLSAKNCFSFLSAFMPLISIIFLCQIFSPGMPLPPKFGGRGLFWYFPVYTDTPLGGSSAHCCSKLFSLVKIIFPWRAPPPRFGGRGVF